MALLYIIFALLFILQSQCLAIAAGACWYRYKAHDSTRSRKAVNWLLIIQGISVLLWQAIAACGHLLILALSGIGAVTFFFATYYLVKKVMESEKKLSPQNIILSLIYLGAYITFLVFSLGGHAVSVDCGI